MEFHEIWYLSNFQKISGKNSSFIKLGQDHPVLYLKRNINFWSYLAQFFLEWEMFQTKVVQNLETHILWSITFFRNSCLLWDNMEKYCPTRQVTDDNIIRRMRIACWIPNVTNTHSEYVVLISFPLQQWLHERTSVLRYTYIACLVSSPRLTGWSWGHPASVVNFPVGKMTRAWGWPLALV